MRTLRWRSALQPAFVAASVAWAALLLLAPFAASRPHASAAGTALVVAVYAIGSLLCHQLPERSYRVWSAQMPVCARCAGIYFGAAMAAIAVSAASLKRRLPHHKPEPEALKRLPPCGAVAGLRVSSAAGSRVALIVAVAPTLATLVFEWTTGRMPAHSIRAAAGVPIGAVAAWLVSRHARDRRVARPEPVEG